MDVIAVELGAPDKPAATMLVRKNTMQHGDFTRSRKHEVRCAWQIAAMQPETNGALKGSLLSVVAMQKTPRGLVGRLRLLSRGSLSVTHLTEGDSISANPATKLAVDRTRLGFERTMLSWVRTAISLISFGFSIPQFFRIARTGLPESKDFIGPDEFGLLLIVIGLLALLVVTLEHRASIEALKVQYPVTEGYQSIPRSRASTLAGLIAVLGLLALVSILLRKLSLII